MSRQLGPGWYPDPFGEGALRWWDGTKWETPVSGGAADAVGAPPAAPLPSAFDRTPLPPETQVHTVWIWLVLLLPLLSTLISLATLRTVARTFGRLTHPSAANLSLLSSPASLASTLVGLAFFAVSVVFSWLDYRTLERRGVDRPFHWAWTFLAWPVYTIGRAVIVRRVAGGRGMSVLWATIAVVVVSIAAGVAAALILSAAVLQTIHPLPTTGA